MAKGRKPKPTRLKMLQGNPGKRAINKDEPEFEVGAPKKPDWLAEIDIASERWDYLVEQLGPKRVLTVADQGILTLACMAYNRWQKAEQYVEEHGMTYESFGQNGKQIKTRPECAQASVAWRQVQSAEATLGLDPTSRSKVKTIPEKDKESGLRRILG